MIMIPLHTLEVHVQYDHCDFCIRENIKRQDFLCQFVLILCIVITCCIYVIDVLLMEYRLSRPHASDRRRGRDHHGVNHAG